MSNQTILLIDYDPASISRTATPLTKAGYQVEVAKDGLSGLAAFERLKPSLVLVEAMLPRKHGFEVCQEIKAKPDGKSTPVLITTAVCRGRKYRMDALQIYGCDEYIEKPITDDELLSMVARFVEQARQAGEEVQQDLSNAIDAASVGVPVTIESMDDDELEAKIDALLAGDDTPAEDAALDAETETERQLDTIDQVDPAKVDQPDEPVLLEHDAEATALPVLTPPIAEEPIADPLVAAIEPQFDAQPEPAPSVDMATVAPAEPERKKGGPKVVVLGVAAVAVLGLVGFFAIQRGWIGGAAASEPAPTGAADNVSRLANHVSAPKGPAPALQPPAMQGIVDQEPVEPAPPAEIEPKPKLLPQATFKPRGAEELRAAQNRQVRADRALNAAAGSLQSQLLSEQAGDSLLAQDETIKAVNVDGDDLIGTPTRPKALRGELFALHEVDRSPVRVRFEQPVYDDLARRMNQQGVVVVEVLIDETGQVAEARLVQEIPKSRLNQATLRAARRWSYQPAVKDDVPVKVWKSERIVFELE